MNTSEIKHSTKSPTSQAEQFLILSPSNSNSIKEGILIMNQFQDELSAYKTKIEEQRKIIIQYENWLANLVDLMDSTEYSEYSPQVRNVNQR